VNNVFKSVALTVRKELDDSEIPSGTQVLLGESVYLQVDYDFDDTVARRKCSLNFRNYFVCVCVCVRVSVCVCPSATATAPTFIDGFG
jgi:hypothetical protein